MKMKYFIFLLVLNYFIKISSSSTKVVNSCGLTTSDQPTCKEQCKDPNEPACKMVTVEIDHIQKKFCAIIHGKYNDDQVLKEVKDLIKGDDVTVTVEGNGYMYNLNYIIILFFTILLFL